MNGVVNVYKEAGVTSFDVVSSVKKILNVSKCGHLGTLDPMAEGVLPVCVGYATRFADYLSSVNKEYIAEFKLGVKSDSYDITGSLVECGEDIKPTDEELRLVFSTMTGNVELKVPAYSAKKINGVRAYQLARRGEIEDAGFRSMEIFSIELLSYDYPYGIIRVSCGKGTYIRSIINSAGENLGTGAVMSGLIRSVNGLFKSKDALKISDLKKLSERGNVLEAVKPVTDFLDWGRAVVKDSVIPLIKNGISPDNKSYLSFPIEHEGDLFFIMDSRNNLLAAAERAENSETPLKLKMVLI